MTTAANDNVQSSEPKSLGIRESAAQSPKRRTRCTLRQRDLTAAIKAVAKAGCEVSRIEFDSEGKVVIIIGSAGQSPLGDELDQELAAFEARHAC